MYSPQRRTAFLLVFGFSFLPILLLLPVSQGSGPTSNVPLFAVIALVLLSTATLFAGARLGTEADQRRFQQDMIVALALSESASILGFVGNLGNPATYLLFLAGTLGVNVLFIAPRVAAFYR